MVVKYITFTLGNRIVFRVLALFKKFCPAESDSIMRFGCIALSLIHYSDELVPLEKALRHSKRRIWMDVITINIAGKESINLVCSKCGCAREISISSLPNLGKVYKIKCKCIHGFSVAFDKRKYRRKKINIVGTYSLEHSLTDHIIDIIDLSRGGLGFIRTDKNKLIIGDRLTVNFNLDNAEGDLIRCSILVRNILGNRVCGEFVGMPGRMQTTLGFYFM